MDVSTYVWNGDGLAGVAEVLEHIFDQNRPLSDSAF